MCVGFLDTFCTLSEWWETEGERRAEAQEAGCSVLQPIGPHNGLHLLKQLRA